MAAAEIIERLKTHGCQPREVAQGVWFALCPSCLAEGRQELLVVRTDSGSLECRAEGAGE